MTSVVQANLWSLICITGCLPEIFEPRFSPCPFSSHNDPNCNTCVGIHILDFYFRENEGRAESSNISPLLDADGEGGNVFKSGRGATDRGSFISRSPGISAIPLAPESVGP